MARDAAMATIDAALLAAQQPKQDESNNQALPRPGPTDMPGVPPTEERKPAPPLTKEQQEILEAQKKLLGEEEAKRLREEQEQLNARSALRKSAEATLKNSQKVIKQVDTRIGSIPQPGSILLPLVLLLLFFFILIQVGGYNRLTWLGLAILGRAQVTDTQQSFLGPGSGELPPSQTGDTGLPPLSITTASKNGVYGGPY